MNKESNSLKADEEKKKKKKCSRWTGRRTSCPGNRASSGCDKRGPSEGASYRGQQPPAAQLSPPPRSWLQTSRPRLSRRSSSDMSQTGICRGGPWCLPWIFCSPLRSAMKSLVKKREERKIEKNKQTTTRTTRTTRTAKKGIERKGPYIYRGAHLVQHWGVRDEPLC